MPKLPEPEENYIFRLSDEKIAAMMVFAKHVAVAIEKAIPCKRLGMAVLGMEVPHVHVHLVPLQTEKDLIFSNPRKQFTPEEMKEVAQAIAANVEL